VVACFYRTCLIDGLIDRSPAAHVRRPPVSAESPTLGLSHLQFEAMLTAARESVHSCDFALVCMLGLLGLRIFEATGVTVADLGEEHGHRVLKVHGKGDKTVLVPLPPAVARAIDRAVGERTAGPILLHTCGTGMDRQAGTRRLRHLAKAAGMQMPRMHPHMLRHTFVTTMLDPGVDLRDVQIAARHADPRTTMRYDRARTNLDRQPNYILAAYMASGWLTAEEPPKHAVLPMSVWCGMQTEMWSALEGGTIRCGSGSPSARGHDSFPHSLPPATGGAHTETVGLGAGRRYAWTGRQGGRRHACPGDPLSGRACADRAAPDPRRRRRGHDPVRVLAGPLPDRATGVGDRGVQPRLDDWHAVPGASRAGAPNPVLALDLRR
jgi:integrase/recombinase XerD